MVSRRRRTLFAIRAAAWRTDVRSQFDAEPAQRASSSTGRTSPRLAVRSTHAPEKSQDRIGGTLWQQPMKYGGHGMSLWSVDDVYDSHQEIVSWWDEHLKSDPKKSGTVLNRSSTSGLGGL
jgi:hypothetical protein